MLLILVHGCLVSNVLSTQCAHLLNSNCKVQINLINVVEVAYKTANTNQLYDAPKQLN